MNRGTAFALLVCIATSGGCASPARIISYNAQDGTGTVAIPNNTDTWPTHNRKAAEDLIAKTVGSGYMVMSEGEFVKGKRKQVTLDSNSASYTQQKLTEYRISFVRVSHPATPAAATGLTQTGGQVPATGPVVPPGTTPGPTPVGAPPQTATGAGNSAPGR